MPARGQLSNSPPVPTGSSRAEFGAALRALRHWAGLTQHGLERAHPDLCDATISDHERGVRLPRWEWVTINVTACLRHRLPEATDAQLAAHVNQWRTQWARLNHVVRAADTQGSSVAVHGGAHRPGGGRTRAVLVIGPLRLTDELDVLAVIRLLGGLAHVVVTHAPDAQMDDCYRWRPFIRADAA